MKKSAVQTARLSWNDEGTPVSEQFDDVYFSNQDGLEETRYVFYKEINFQRALKYILLKPVLLPKQASVLG